MIELRRRVMASGKIEYPLGVWAYYANGTIKDYDHADANAIGVALVTNNVAFVLRKYTDGGNALGGQGVNLDSAVPRKTSEEAKLDFNGNEYTTALISALSGVTDNQGITGAQAAEHCRTYFNGRGYLGTLGEYWEIYQNKSSINSMLSKIDGQLLYDYWNWTISLANPGWSTDTSVWIIKFDDSGSITRASRSSYYSGYGTLVLCPLV